jgi:hypothetical protein
MEQTPLLLAIAWVKDKKLPQVRKKPALAPWSCRARRGYEAGRHDEAENATFGISFCGRRRAITAQNKHGYKAKYGMRSVDEGVTAINEGYNVLGFGFMDKEELGERLVEAWKKKYGA